MSRKETKTEFKFESAIYAEKEVNIISAAQKLFLRHGLKKVSMSDIAEASKLSRPTLYAAFASKAEVVEGLIKLHTEMNRQKTLQRVSSDQPLRAQVEEICEVWITEPFASAIDTEHGKEVMETIEEFAGDTVNEMYAALEDSLVSVLKPHFEKKTSLSAKDVAHIIATATRGLKVSTETLPELRRLIKGLITMTMALVK